MYIEVQQYSHTHTTNSSRSVAAGCREDDTTLSWIFQCSRSRLIALAYVTCRELFHALRTQKVVLREERVSTHMHGTRELSMISVGIESIYFNRMP